MSSTIIELSRVTSNETSDNATWKNTLKSGIIIEEGDQILLKNCYVDTTTLSSNNFIFEEDINIHMEFAFYLLGTGIEQVALLESNPQQTYNMWTTQDITNNSDGLPYICIIDQPGDPKKGSPYIDYMDFTIPKGTYSKTFLSQFISRKMQTLNVLSQSYWPGVWSHYPQDPASVPPPPYPVIESVYQQLYMQNQTIYGSPGYFECSVGIPPIDNPITGNIQVISPAHCDVIFYAFLKDLPQQTSYLNERIFQKCAATAPGEDNTDYDGGYMGCVNMSISFNNDSQKYQIDYLHTPITDTTQNELTCIAHTQPQPPTPSKITFLNQRGGIMLTKLEPASFWQDTLGFDLSGVVFNDPTFSTTTYNEWYSKTTQNFPAMEQLINHNQSLKLNNFTIQSSSTIIGLTETYNFTQSTSTIPIIAPNLSIGTIISAGHYLIDIKGYTSNYKNAFGDNQIKGLVSAFFTSPDNFLCSPGPDSAYYIHHGSPMPINSFEVTIIDPLTHQPSKTLGPSSSVYLQVIKNKIKAEDE